MAVRRGPLHAVDAGEAAPSSRPRARRSAKPKSVKEAATTGTDRELLVALRDRIAEDLDSRSTLARDLASLSKRLMELQREIKAIDDHVEQEGKGKGGPVPDAAFDASSL